MRNFTFCILFILIFTIGRYNGYAQTPLETGEESGESNEIPIIIEEANELPKIILERDFFNYSMGIAWHQYKYLDGTLLKYRDVRPIILEVPGNDAILKKEKSWFIVNIISGILFAGSYATWSANNGFDLYYSNVIAPVSVTGMVVSLLMAISAKELEQYYMRQAVTRYNLHIQDLPMQ